MEDVLIEYSQALEMSNIYASIINGTMDAYASIISNNLNVVMKFMAAMTIVLTVPPLITGFFGMNVPFPHDGAAFAANPMPFILLLLVNIGSVVLVALAETQADVLARLRLGYPLRKEIFKFCLVVCLIGYPSINVARNLCFKKVSSFRIDA